MTAKQFAEQYAGYLSKHNVHGIGRIVGHSLPYVIVEYMDGPSWRIDDHDGQLVSWVVSDPKCGWKVRPESLKIIDKPPKILAKPYPHICKICRQPARKIAALTLCSNDKCRSNKIIKNKYKHKVSTKEIQVEYRLSSGHIYHPEVWAKGGCAICGWYLRDKGTEYAHNKCWDEWHQVFYNGEKLIDILTQYLNYYSQYKSAYNTTKMEK